MKLKVTQIKSNIGVKGTQVKTLKSLGLNGKIGKSVIHNNTPDIRGKVKQVIHLVNFEEVKK